MDRRSSERRHDDAPKRTNAEPQVAARPSRIQEALGNQGMLEILSASPAAEDFLTEQAEPPSTVAVPGWIVDDDAGTLRPQQMHRTAFLNATRQRIHADVEPLLASIGRTAEDCPLLDFWFDYYGQRDAAHIERALRRFTPAQNATSAADYISLVVERVHQGVETWVSSGEITQLPPDVPAVARQMVQFNRDQPGATPSANFVRKQIGKGQPLTSAVRDRMERVFGTSFGHVRTHTADRAASLAHEHRARAFTVGSDVVFGQGQYEPGSLAGDVLIAHELAHVIQQTRHPKLAAAQPAEAALERDANQSTLAIIRRLWGQAADMVQNVLPHLRSGVQMQRCDPTGHLDDNTVTANAQDIIRTLELVITPSPEADRPFFVGKTVHAYIDSEFTDSTFTYPRATQFTVELPDGSTRRRIPDSDGISAIMLEQTGRTRIHAMVAIGLGFGSMAITRVIDVVNPRTRAIELLREYRRLDLRNERILRGEEDLSHREEVRTRQEAIMSELRFLGVLMQPLEISERLRSEAPADLLTVTGDIIRVSSGPLYRGQPETFQVDLDYVPPGDYVEIEWRWKRDNGPRENRFIEQTGRTRNLRLTIRDLTWNGGLRSASQVQIIAHVYLNDDSTAQDTLTTPFITIQDDIPDQIFITPADPTVIQGTEMEFRLQNWTPLLLRSIQGGPKYETFWYVNGRQVTGIQPNLRREFRSVGSQRVTARIYRVAEDDSRSVFREAQTTVTVQSAQTAGTQALRQMTQQEIPSLSARQTEIEGEISRLSALQSRGSEQAAYYREQTVGQQRRLRLLREHVQDMGIPNVNALQTLPNNIFDLERDQAYAGPIPAVLVMPQTQGTQPLQTYLVVKHNGTEWQARIIDITSSDVWKFDGSSPNLGTAYTHVLDDWASDHPYARGGRVVYRFNGTNRHFNTTNTWNTFKAWVDGILAIGGFIAVGLLLIAPTWGVTQTLGYALLTMGIARSGIAIYENIDLGMDVLDRRNILEAVNILLAVIGISGSAMRAIGLRAIRPLIYRVGSYTVVAALAGDVGTLVYMSADAIRMMRVIQADPNLTEEQRQSQAIRLMSSLFLQGTLLVITNRDMFTGPNRLRRSDFIPTDPRATVRGAAGRGHVELEPGQRLDVAAQLRARGDIVERLRTGPVEEGRPRSYSDREVLDRFDALPWLEQSLSPTQLQDILPRMETDAINSLRNSGFDAGHIPQLYNDIGSDVATNALTRQMTGQQLRALVDAVSGPKLCEVFQQFGAAGTERLRSEVGTANLGRLLTDWTVAHFAQRVEELGTGTLHNLSNGLSPRVIDDLITAQGANRVQWAGSNLPGNQAREVLQLPQNVIDGLMNIPSNRAHELLTQLGRNTVETAIPTISGSQLSALTEHLGSRTARGYIDDTISRRGRGDLVQRAAANLQGINTTIAAPSPLQAHSVIADSNTLVSIDKLMQGTPWAGLNPPEQNAINRLRALRGLPALTTDPPDLSLHGIIGNSDLRVGNATIGEMQGRAPGLAVGAIELSVPRNDPAYVGVLRQLEGVDAAGNRIPGRDPVGGNKGYMDRAEIADALFANTNGGIVPTLVTADRKVFPRLAEYFAPAGTIPTRNRLPGGGLESVADAIIRGNRNGFVITVNGRRLRIIPVQ